MKKALEEKFHDIPLRVIILALETAEYDEERAEQFLIASRQEENIHQSSEEHHELQM